MTRRSALTRRALLRGASTFGLAAAATPWLPLRSEAETSAYPRRLLLLFQPNGTIPENWWPTGTELDWTLGANLQALQPYADKLIFVDGVYKYGQGFGQGGGPGNEHRKGISMLWTGSANISVGGADWNGGTSIDQAIAAQIGSETPFRSLELGVVPGDSFFGNRMIYAGPGQPVAPEHDPWQAFDRIFEGITDDPEKRAEFERLKLRRKSVIDFALTDLERTRSRVSQADRLKIEAHLDGLRSIEKRLDGVAATCSPPALGPRPDLIRLTDEVSRAHVDNVAMAFACDLTRVASIQFGWANTLQSFNGAPHHDLSHRIADNHDLGAMAQMEEIDRWYAEQVAYVLERLDAVPEGDGTMLDNTLVVWGNEIANGVTYDAPGRTHLVGRTPLMMAGGGNFAFETGRYLRYAQPDNMNETAHEGWEVHHHRVLVSIARAMGLDLQSYGDLDQGTGPAPGLVPIA